MDAVAEPRFALACDPIDINVVVVKRARIVVGRGADQKNRLVPGTVPLAPRLLHAVADVLLHRADVAQQLFNRCGDLAAVVEQLLRRSG